MSNRGYTVRRKGQKFTEAERLIRGMGPDEDTIQKLVIESCAYLKYENIPLTEIIRHIPNGGFRLESEAKKLKAMGVVPGTPDLHIPVSKHGFSSLYIELKTKDGDLRPDQKKQIPILRKLGNKVVVIRSYEDAMHEIKSYLGI
nr:VRR-NUC domain-containing protein [uncultured Acinetobacter sp.]